MTTVKAIALLLFVILVQACSQPQQTASSEKTQASEQKAKPQEAPFDLQQVQKDYQGTKLTVLDISERTRDGRNSIAVTLAVPLDPAINHQAYFKITNAKREVVDGAWVLSKSGKIVWFSNTEPNQHYLIEVSQGLTAANGGTLMKDKAQRLKTRDLKPSVNFDTNGAFLSKGLSHGLPVVTVNVSEANIDFFRVNEDKTEAFLQQVQYSYNYWDMGRLTQYGELVYSGRYAFDAAKNTRTKRTIETGNIEALQQSGVYLAVMQPAGSYDNKQLLWFSVTDLGVHVRQYHNQVDVHVSSLKTGKPLSGIKVSLYNKKNGLIKTLNSDTKGLASFLGMGSNVRLIVAQTEGQYSVVQTRMSALDLSEFDVGNRPQLPIDLFIYAPRDLYRPGEVVDFNALIRDGDGKQTKAPVLDARIKRPDGSTIHQFKWQGQALGYYHQSWQIPTNASVGNWELVVNGPFNNARYYSFKVEEFLPERMKITFNPTQDNQKDRTEVIGADQPVKVPVLGEYLYGAPGSGNRLSTMVNVSLWRNPIPSLKNYQFGDINNTTAVQQFEIDDIKLDLNGQGLITVPVHWRGVKSPLKVKLISSLYESGGRPVTRLHSALVWPQESMLGIRNNFKTADGQDGPKANSRVKFDIVKANLAGELQAASNLEVKLIREDRQYFWVFNNGEGWHYNWTDKEYTEISQALDIKDGTKAEVEFPVGYGHYRVEVRDPANNLTTSTRFHAGYNWYARWRDTNSGSQAAHPDKVTMALDKPLYKGGDIAQVTIVPPTAGEAIVMVEGDGPLWMQRVSIAKEGTTVAIPVDEKWDKHNLYVTAVVLRKGDDKQAITPNRSFGMTHLALDRTARKLQVDINLPDKVLPEQTVNAELKINGAANNMTGEVYVTLAAVDVGVLSISDFETPDPFEYFFGQRAYSVQSRDIYDKVIEVNNAQKAQLRFGGDADLSRGGKKPQSEVQIVSLFSGPVKVQNGVANIPLKLPAFNGQLRLMAVAYGVARFGHSEKAITVAAPVVTQIAMPRFLAMGDTTTIALDLNNISDEAQTLDIDFGASGPVALESASQTLTLASKQATTLRFEVKATGHTGQAQFDLTVKGIKVDGQTSTIKRSWKLGLRPPYPAVMLSKQKILRNREKIGLDGKDIAHMIPETVEAVLSVDNKVQMNLSSHLKHLLAYPYGCLEQTSSRAFPLTYATLKNQQRFDLQTIEETSRLEMIKKGIERVASMQLNNGGFGLWSNTSPEEHWLTAYVADFLLSAKDMGVDVPYELLSATMSRLRTYVNRPSAFVQERWSEDAGHYSIAYKAYAAYVLARVNRAPLGSLRTLYNKKMDDAASGLPKVHLGIALSKMGDKKRGNKAIEQGLQDIINVDRQQRYYGDYGSTLRDKAMVIHLLLTNNIHINEAVALSFSLANDIREAQWLSTQERNSLFLAGIALAKRSSEGWSANLIENGAASKLPGNRAYYKKLNAADINGGLVVESNNKNPLFVSALVSGYGIEKPPVLAEGLKIDRQWYNKDGKAINPTEVKVGELVIVHLTLTAKKRTPDALLVDLLPAGFELENQNLGHAIKLDQFKVDGQTYKELTGRTNIKHMEYRDDRFVAALDISKHRASHVFYLLRAVTPGTYVVPSPLVEDMYNPQKRAVGDTLDPVTVKNVSL